jgi:hypothetical protein
VEDAAVKLSQLDRATQIAKRRARLLEGIDRIRRAPEFNSILKISIGGLDVVDIWREGCGSNRRGQRSPDVDMLSLLPAVRRLFERKAAQLERQLRRLGVEP